MTRLKPTMPHMLAAVEKTGKAMARKRWRGYCACSCGAYTHYSVPAT